MSSSIDPLTECGMVDDVLFSDSDSIVLVEYMFLRLGTLRMFCMSTLLFDIRLICLKVPNLA